MFTDNSPLQAAKLSILATTTKFQWAADTQIPDHYHVRCRNKNEDNLSCSWISCTTRNDTQGCGVGLQMHNLIHLHEIPLFDTIT